MSWTKGQLITEAFGELTLALHDFDITPEETQSALRRLEALLGTWAGKGLTLGYRFASSPDHVDANEDSGLPLYAIETTFLHLAERIAAGKGKQLSLTTRATARDGFDRLLRAAAFPPAQQVPAGMPLGAGHKGPYLYGPRFTTGPTEGPLQIAEDGGLAFGS
jgi:hypothetical protein